MRKIGYLLLTALLSSNALAFEVGSEVAVSCPKQRIFLGRATLVSTNGCDIVVSSKGDRYVLNAADTTLSQPTKTVASPALPVGTPASAPKAPESEATVSAPSHEPAPELPAALQIKTYAQKLEVGGAYIKVKGTTEDAKAQLRQFFQKHPEVGNAPLGTYWIIQFPTFAWRTNDKHANKGVVVDNNLNYAVLNQTDTGGGLILAAGYDFNNYQGGVQIYNLGKDGQLHRVATPPRRPTANATMNRPAASTTKGYESTTAPTLPTVASMEPTPELPNIPEEQRKTYAGRLYVAEAYVAMKGDPKQVAQVARIRQFLNAHPEVGNAPVGTFSVFQFNEFGFKTGDRGRIVLIAPDNSYKLVDM